LKQDHAVEQEDEIEFLVVLEVEPELAVKDEEEDEEQDAGAKEAQLLADDRDDKIGVPRRQELVAGLRALEVAFAGQSTRADGDLGLDDVVAGGVLVSRGIEEGNEAVLLVGFEQRMPAGW
jgi:hypothetical protein